MLLKGLVRMEPKHTGLSYKRAAGDISKTFSVSSGREYCCYLVTTVI